MRDYLAEYLEKNLKNTPVYEVSKVSKGAKETFDTFDTRQTGKHSVDFSVAIDFQKPEQESEYQKQNESIVQMLNAMIARGVSFNVSQSDFEVRTADRLTVSEKDFLRINKPEVLCTLQQSLLMKHLFSHSRHLFSDFTFEIAEAQTRRADAEKLIPYEIYFEAVQEVSKNWFTARLLARI